MKNLNRNVKNRQNITTRVYTERNTNKTNKYHKTNKYTNKTNKYH